MHLHISTPDAPIVNLTLGANLNPENIRQGDDVYFECKHTANPPVQKITWFKEVRYCVFIYNIFSVIF